MSTRKDATEKAKMVAATKAESELRKAAAAALKRASLPKDLIIGSPFHTRSSTK